jgi:hypothetical protein
MQPSSAMPAKAKIRFVCSGRGKARCKSHPDYPNGIAVDGSNSALPRCKFDLGYPAPACGMWVIDCENCGISVAVTAAGRRDDPKSVTVNCLNG